MAAVCAENFQLYYHHLSLNSSLFWGFDFFDVYAFDIFLKQLEVS